MNDNNVSFLFLLFGYFV